MATELMVLSTAGRATLPALLADAGEKAQWRFIDFFAARIRNPNTREAYWRAVNRFTDWGAAQGLQDLHQIRPLLVAAYVEQMLADGFSKPTVKQHLAAIRKLFDWMVSGGVLELNPASSVESPKHIVRKGKTPALDADQTRQLLDGIPTETIAGLRDRALIGTMVYTFGRVSAVLNMQVGDYFQSGKRWCFRLHEKGGKYHEVPAHHNAEAYVDAYIEAGRDRQRAQDPPVSQYRSHPALNRQADASL